MTALKSVLLLMWLTATAYSQPTVQHSILSADGSNLGAPAGASHVTLSPDGTRIAYVLEVSGNYDIYVAEIGGATTRLTNHPKQEFNPAWSPDGTRIAFASLRDGDSEIFVIDANGANERQLTNNNYGDIWPTWAPGNQIAWESQKNNIGNIHTISGGGGDERELTSTPFSKTQPAWAPGGAKIAYASGEIHIANADGGNDKVITSAGGRAKHPTWSPDGTKIAFASDHEKGAIIYTVKPDGSDLQVVSSGSSPTWSGWLPVLQLTAPSVGAGAVNVNSSGTVNFGVQNAGGGRLAVKNISSNNPRFAVSPTSFSLAGGATQLISLTFSPATTGLQTGTLSFSASVIGLSVPTLSVSGNGVAVDSVPTPPPAAPIGLTATVTGNQIGLTWNPNGEALFSHYVIYRSQTPGFSPAPTDSVGRTNRPGSIFIDSGLSLGSYRYRITAVDSLGGVSSPSGEVSGTIASVAPPPANPAIAVSTILVMDSPAVGSSSQRTLIISNVGTANLNITGLAVGGPNASEFSVSATSTTIGPSANYNLTVTFSPTSVGSKSASITIIHNAAGNPSIVNIIGTGPYVEPPPPPPEDPPQPPRPRIEVSTERVGFGNIEIIKSTASSGFTIRNRGYAVLNGSLRLQGNNAGEFGTTFDSFSIGPDSSQTFTVLFRPTSLGAKNAELVISHNAPGLDIVVRFSGTGIPVSVDFDNDGTVGFADFVLFSKAFGQEPSGANRKFDLDGNGEINFLDFLAFTRNLGGN